MTLGMIKTIFEQIDLLGQDQVTISWHGGEPLLFGKDKFRKAFEYQKSLKTKFKNVIQTNGILIDDGWVKFFKKNGFLVGVSLDGYRSVQNYNRPLPNGKESFDLVMRGLNRLVDADLCGGIISVISDKTDANRYFSFIKTLGIKSFHTKPCSSEWEGSISLKDFARFSEELFNLWIENDDPDFSCRTFKGYAENLLGGQANLCHQSGRCFHFLSINTNGDVYPCDELMSLDKKLGNVLNEDLSVILNSAGWDYFCSSLLQTYSECKDQCSDYDACGGGCTAERLFHGNEDYCEERRAIISKVRQWVDSNQEALV